ncbi:cold-shock protein [Streptomyces capitiformicae]|uniref:cold-shock protein n=1 Tax=Streptomyces capitiformicae TaxID=2014920 RepID=UPI001AD7E5A7
MKWLDPERGLGRLAQDDGGPNAVVHRPAIHGPEEEAPAAGERVLFDITFDSDGIRADNIRPAAEAPPDASRAAACCPCGTGLPRKQERATGRQWPLPLRAAASSPSSLPRRFISYMVQMTRSAVDRRGAGMPPRLPGARSCDSRSAVRVAHAERSDPAPGKDRF